MWAPLVPGPHGELLMELELTEPQLFHGHVSGSADRLATAIASRIRCRSCRPYID